MSAPRAGSTGAGVALTIICVVGFLSYLDRMVIAGMLPAIKSDLSLTDSQAGLLSTGFGLACALAGLPLGRGTDRLPRNRLIAAALAAWSLATLWCGLTASFVGLASARMGVALGEAAFVPAAFSILSDYFPPERRHLAMTTLVVCISMGTAIGLAVGGIVAAAYGWRAGFLVAGGPGVVMAVICLLFLREPSREQPRGDSFDEDAKSGASVIAALGSNRPYVWIALTTGLNGFCVVGIAQWLPSYFARAFGVSLAEIGLSFGIAFGIGTCAGQMLGGVIAGRLTRRSGSAPILLCIAANTLIIPGFSAVLLAGSLRTAAVLTFLTAIIGAIGAVAQGVGVQNAVLPRQRGLAQSIVGMLVSIMGLAIGPLVVGMLSDRFAVSADPAAGLREALLFSQFFFVLAAYTACRAYSASRIYESGGLRRDAAQADRTAVDVKV